MEEFFSNFSLFEDFSNNDLKQFIQNIKEVKLSANDILLRQGTLGADLYFLKEGILEVYITGPNEYVHIVDSLKPPSIIGEMELFDNKPLIATVKAQTNCILFVISYDDFLKTLIEHPLMNQRIVTIILSKWRNVETGIHQVISTMLKSSDYLSKFALAVNHDLRSPLQSVMGYVQLLQYDQQNKVKNDNLEYLKLIEKNIQKINQLIDGIYKYSVAIQHAQDDFAIVDIKEVINEVIQLLAPSKDIKISISDPIPTIYSNRIQMIQVFQNLLDNAIKSLDKPEKIITISCDDLEDYWEFSITDNGIGIKQQDQTRIMKIFQRVNTDKQYNGTGIGLAIVERIVILHGGRFWVNSEFGKGSTFYFTISKAMLQYMKLTE